MRAFKDEPVCLHALSVGREVVEVAGRDLSKSIGFPKSRVFRFKKSLFQKLSRAFQDGDGDTLRRLWKQAEPIGRGE